MSLFGGLCKSRVITPLKKVGGLLRRVVSVMGLKFEFLGSILSFWLKHFQFSGSNFIKHFTRISLSIARMEKLLLLLLWDKEMSLACRITSPFSNNLSCFVQ